MPTSARSTSARYARCYWSHFPPRVAVSVDSVRTDPIPLVLWNRLARERGQSLWLLVLFEINPRAMKFIEIAAKSKTTTGPLEGLRVGRCHGIRIVGPFFTCACVRPKTDDCDSAGHQNLSSDDALAAFDPGDIAQGFDTVFSSPSLWSEQSIQPVRIRAGISIGHDLCAFPVFCCVRHPPLDLIGGERHLQFPQNRLEVEARGVYRQPFVRRTPA